MKNDLHRKHSEKLALLCCDSGCTFVLQAAYGCRPLVVGRFGSTAGLSAVSTSQVLNSCYLCGDWFALWESTVLIALSWRKKSRNGLALYWQFCSCFCCYFCPFYCNDCFRPPFPCYAGSQGGCFTYHKLCKNLWEAVFLHCCFATCLLLFSAGLVTK